MPSATLDTQVDLRFDFWSLYFTAVSRKQLYSTAVCYRLKSKGSWLGMAFFKRQKNLITSNPLF